MLEHPEWRLERYTDEMDPFASIQWYVMQNNLVIAQCEIEANGQSILAEQTCRVRYETALKAIAAMSPDAHALADAVRAAAGALDSPD